MTREILKAFLGNIKGGSSVFLIHPRILFFVL